MTWLRTTGLRVLLALGLGFALWSYVTYRENPNRTISYEDVPVDVAGLSPGLLLVDQNGLPRTTRQSVNVVAEGDEATVRNVRTSDFRAFVDVSGLQPGEQSVAVNITPNRSGLARLTFSADPPLLSYRIEEAITKTVALTTTISGIVPFSFERQPAQLTFNTQPITGVLVSGPQGQVDRVDIARVTANIDRLTANYSSSRTVEPVDADGELVEGVTITPDEINVLVPIVSSAGTKRVPVIPQVAGSPASGSVVSDLVVEPAFVQLTGSSGPLDSIQSIETTPVDVSGASGVISRTVTLIEPEGASLLVGQQREVVVTVTISPIARPFSVTLPVAVVATNPPDGLLVSLSPQVIEVQLSGTSGQLAGLDASSLRGTINISGLTAGTYTLTPEFALPQGITLLNEPRVTVTLRPPPTAIPTDAPEPTAPADTATPEATAEPTAAPVPTDPAPQNEAPPTAEAAPTAGP